VDWRCPVTKRQVKRRTKALRRRASKQWRRLDTPQRAVVVSGTVVELTLFALAQIDISRRDSAEIRGSKLLWRAICLISFVGPVLYFTVGRITPEPADEPETPASIVA
jgi:hypothetical protein